MKTFDSYLKKQLQNKKFAGYYRQEKDLAELAVKIAEARAMRNMSQRQLAEKANITQQQLSRMETGSNCTMSNFIRVCEALGMRIDLNMSGKKACSSAR